jgi:hypothetical protein
MDHPGLHGRKHNRNIRLNAARGKPEPRGTRMDDLRLGSGRREGNTGAGGQRGDRYDLDEFR